MLSERRIVVAAILMTCLCGTAVQATVYEPCMPTGFPEMVITRTNQAAPGVFIGTMGRGYANMFYVILDNSGYPLYYSKNQPLSRFVQPNGFIGIGAMGVFNFKDETLTRVDSFALTQGYTLDTHDVKLLTNGHALLMGKEVRSIDMSQLVPGGRPDARVTGNVIQEIDANKQVVFEWHTFDHIPITDSFHDLTQKTIDYAHINSVALDPLDNSILISLRTTSEIVKISRSTGEVIWRLSGKGNDFTFIGEHEENAPYYTVGQHDVTRFANGNLLYFDNGNISGGGINPCDRNYSRAVEYRLDETSMTATLVWEYRHTPDISAPCTGFVKRFDNGNTLVDWGCAIAKSGTVATEVSPLGEVVFEMSFPQPGPTASMTKQLWNRPDLVTWQTYPNVEAGQTYDATTIGVSVTVNGLTDDAGYNGLAIQKYAEATRFPRFVGKEPLLLVKRVTLTGYGITDADVNISFDTKDLGAKDASQLTVYHRPCAGQGEFTALTTAFDAAGTLTVANASLGEFVFGYPDVPDLALQPILYSPEDLATVNQTQPVTLRWTPRGFGRSYDLQVATDPQFTVLKLDQSGLTESRYTLETLEPGTTYYWRVNVSNYAATSEWVTHSFTAVQPKLQVTAPNGGEQWQRGLKYFIQWEDNLTESVVVDLYKGETLIKTIATVATDPAYQWVCSLDLQPGDDYSIRVKSATDAAMTDTSDGAFTVK